MSDYRKMVLLEEAEVDRLRQKQIREYDPTIGAMAHAQADIDDALTKSKLSDEQKLNLLFQAQQRFRHLRASFGPIPSQQTTIAVAAPQPAQQLAPANVPQHPGMAQQQQQQPPQAFGSTRAAPTLKHDIDDAEEDEKYNELQDYLKGYAKVLRSNAKGELVYRNKAIPDSSYYQIMSSFVKGENTLMPGSEEFQKGLQIVNAPHHFFSPSSSSFPLTTTQSKPLSDLTSSSLTKSSSTETSRKRTTRVQKGKGPPPGNRPRLIWLYP